MIKKLHDNAYAYKILKNHELLTTENGGFLFISFENVVVFAVKF